MPYDYIQRMYGSRFEGGQRVIHEGCGRHGTVLDVVTDPHHVRVEFDDGTRGPCHPWALAILMPVQSYDGA